MNPLTVNRIPALLALLFAALLAGAVPAAATDLGANSVFKPGDAPAAAKALGELASDEDKRVDVTDSPDPDAIHLDRSSDLCASRDGATMAPASASGFTSQATLSYRARAPPAN